MHQILKDVISVFSFIQSYAWPLNTWKGGCVKGLIVLIIILMGTRPEYQ